MSLRDAIKQMMPAPVKRALRGRPDAHASERAWVADGRLRHRRYESEHEYIDHQRSKFSARGELVVQTDRLLERVLPERLPPVAGLSVLCLAARLGGEVRAFRSLGAFAVGLDLNPGPENAWVLPGNFHALDFPDACVDIVYTNSLDHALDLPKATEEVTRVLKAGGLALIELTRGEAEGGQFGQWEATSWDSIDDVVRIFEGHGFSVEARLDFDSPWIGQQVRARLTRS